jgi:periplasmic copper chaperone A
VTRPAPATPSAAATPGAAGAAAPFVTPRRTTVLLAGTLLAAVAVTGCSAHPRSDAAGGKPRLSVSGAYVPQPPLADMAAGYFTVRNTGGAGDRLTSVTSTTASDVSLMVTKADGSMNGVGDLPIPAGGSLRLRVGGDHLMLMGLKGGRPAVGQHLSFVLHFARSAPITVTVPVEPASYQPKG